jgi:hypothetical protein
VYFCELYNKSKNVLIMNHFLEILKYILPSLVVFAAAYLVIREFLRKDVLLRAQEARMASSSAFISLKLQAYERLVMYLERISADSLLLRVSRPEYSAVQLHQQLLATVRSEFDHNLSQQLFISDKAWELVRRAREETTKVINTTASSLAPGSDGTALATALLQQYAQGAGNPVAQAIAFLKQEARNTFDPSVPGKKQ